MKCPSCSHETPALGGYCDLCGEPISKRRSEPPSKPAEKAVSHEVMKKLLEVKLSSKASEGADRDGIPREFLALDAGEKIPEFPPVARKLAWAMVAVVSAWTIFMTFWMFMKREKIASRLDGSIHAPAPAEPEMKTD